jgi:hypothetical protein
MQVGVLSGRITTKRISFEAEARVKKMEYVSLKDPEGHWILALVDSVVRVGDKTMVKARVVGYRDERSMLKAPGVPFITGTPVFYAEKDFIREVLGLEKKGLNIGLLEGYKIEIFLPPEHLIKKHVGVLAKTGSGKSYVAGVLLEEFIEKGIPIVILDPHGEYHTLKKENRNKDEMSLMKNYGIKPKGYKERVAVMGTDKIKLNTRLTSEELFQVLPTKISSSQKGLLYSAVKNLEGTEYNLRDIIDEVHASKSNAKWGLISLLEYLQGTGVFSPNPTKAEDLVKKGIVSVLDLKDAKPEVQQIIAMKITEELFHARKFDKIPPFLLVVEEAHNFCPERGFGEVASSKVMRTVASEGRKFGMGLCIISQRPARVDKSVLSQCNSQIILKVTNPNDLKAIVDSVEGVTPGLKEEIKDLPIGMAMVVGVTENPLLVDVRIRKSQHGGEAVKIEEKKEIKRGRELVFLPRFFEKDLRKEIGELEEARMISYPLWRVRGKQGTMNLDLYIDGINGEIVFSKGTFLKRTRGIRTLLEMNPSSRLIVLYLLMNKTATPDKIAEELKMPASTIKSNIQQLLTSKLISTDGYMLRNAMDVDIPKEITTLVLSEKPDYGELATPLEFMVSPEFAKKVSDIWDLKVQAIESVFYPYWLCKRKNKSLLIDAMSLREELDLLDTVRKFV